MDSRVHERNASTSSEAPAIKPVLHSARILGHRHDATGCVRRPIVRLALAVSLSSFLCASLPRGVLGFKLKTHLIVANGALDAIRDDTFESDGGIYYTRVGNLSNVLIGKTDDTIELVRRLKDPEHSATYRKLFRGGVCGPDCFPDLIGGQVWVHVNKGKDYSCDLEWNATACTPSNITFENRPFSIWRSIDYGMYQLAAAKKIENVDDRLTALAFSYGYLSHMIGDGFAHSVVNEWTHTPFEYTNGSGLYGPITEEIKHLAVEGFIDWSMPDTPQSELEIDVPVDFLNTLYASRIPTTVNSGEFAGIYFVKLLQARQLMQNLSSAASWADYAPSHRDAIDRFNTFFDDFAPFFSFISDVGNLRNDIEGIFAGRGVMLTTLTNEWVYLSRCIAQNLIWGANTPFLNNDTCQTHNFEADTTVSEIFDGKLNAAAYFGATRNNPNPNYGKTGVAIAKLEQFVTVLSNRLIELKPSTDIASIATIKSALLSICEDPNVLLAIPCDALRAMFDAIDRILLFLQETYVDPLFQEMKLALLSEYAGPYARDFLEHWDQFEETTSNDQPTFKVNTAFLTEDLRLDPDYSDAILAALAGVSVEDFRNAAQGATSVDGIAANTYSLAETRLGGAINGNDACMRSVWRGLVGGVDAAKNGLDLTQVDSNAEYNWLDCYTVAGEEDTVYRTRLARFVALLRVLHVLHSLVGPTINSLRQFANVETSNDTTRRTLNLGTLYYTVNPTQLTKLGLLDGAGIGDLLLRAGVQQSPFNVEKYSQICREFPHIICDAQQSLDDPNTTLGPLALPQRTVDAERSVTMWFDRPWIPVDGNKTYVRPLGCACTFTDFILGNSPAVATALYNNIFVYPPDCNTCFEYAPAGPLALAAVSGGSALRRSARVVDVHPDAPLSLAMAFASSPNNGAIAFTLVASVVCACMVLACLVVRYARRGGRKTAWCRADSAHVEQLGTIMIPGGSNVTV